MNSPEVEILLIARVARFYLDRKRVYYVGAARISSSMKCLKKPWLAQVRLIEGEDIHEY